MTIKTGAQLRYRTLINSVFEPQHNVAVRPAKTQIRLGIGPVWSESFLSTQKKKLGSLATHWAHSEDTDKTWQMPRLIWVFAGRTVILLVLSWGGSFKQAFYGFKTYCKSPSEVLQQTGLCSKHCRPRSDCSCIFCSNPWIVKPHTCSYCLPRPVCPKT